MQQPIAYSAIENKNLAHPSEAPYTYLHYDVCNFICWRLRLQYGKLLRFTLPATYTLELFLLDYLRVESFKGLLTSLRNIKLA